MTLLIAHRGDPVNHVENTLPALLAAARHGADAIEVDVRRTLDGVAVLHHDRTLRRLWGHPGPVAALTMAAVRRHAPAVPTVREALAALRPHGVPLLVDVPSVGAATAAYRTVLEEGAQDRVWFCGRAPAALWLRRRDPRATILLTWSRRLPPAAALLRRVDPSFFNARHTLLDEAAVRAWHARGTRVCAWVVDDETRQEELRRWGVDAVITNRIARSVERRGLGPGNVA